MKRLVFVLLFGLISGKLFSQVSDFKSDSSILNIVNYLKYEKIINDNKDTLNVSIKIKGIYYRYYLYNQVLVFLSENSKFEKCKPKVSCIELYFDESKKIEFRYKRVYETNGYFYFENNEYFGISYSVRIE